MTSSRNRLLKRLQDTQLTKPDGICTRTTTVLYQEPPDLVNCHASRKISKINQFSRGTRLSYTDARFDSGFNTCRYLQGATVCYTVGPYKLCLTRVGLSKMMRTDVTSPGLSANPSTFGVKTISQPESGRAGNTECRDCVDAERVHPYLVNSGDFVSKHL